MILACAAASLLAGCGFTAAEGDDLTSSELVVRPAPDVAPWPTPDPDRPEGEPELPEDTMAELWEISDELAEQFPAGTDPWIRLPNIAHPRFMVTLAADRLGHSDVATAAALLDVDTIPYDLGLTVRVVPTLPTTK